MLSRRKALQELYENYNKPGHPIAFSGAQKIYLYFKKVLSLKDIDNFLQSQVVYSLHRENRIRPKKHIPTFAYVKRDLIQIDLLDVSQLADDNDGIRFLFIAIDSFSRKAWITPLLRKDQDSVLEGFKKLHAQMCPDGERIQAICSDRGKEFLNAVFQSYLDEHSIELRISKTLNHCGIIERFNRTIQSLLFKYLTQTGSKRYIDKLDLILKTYNNRRHRMIKCTPNQGETEAFKMLIRTEFEKRYSKLKKKEAGLSLGRLVRLRVDRTKFHRSYQQQSTDEVFRICEVIKKHRIPLYRVASIDDNEIIDGNFRKEELVPVNDDMRFRHKKTVRTLQSGKKIITLWGLPTSFKMTVDSEVVQEMLGRGNPPYFQPFLQNVDVL